MNLAHLKQEARENCYATAELTLGPDQVMHLDDVLSLIDKVVDAVEASVVPGPRGVLVDGSVVPQVGEDAGFEMCRASIKGMFRNFRGV